MIRATFHPAPQLARDAVTFARSLLERAHTESQQLERTVRSRLASQIRSMRARARARCQRNADALIAAQSTRAFSAIEVERRAMITEAHQQCLDLAIALAEQMIGEVFERDSAQLAERVRSALVNIATSSRSTLLVHPTHVAELESAFGAHPTRRLAVRGEPSLEPGDAIIETATGKIELRWRSHFHELIQAMISSSEVSPS